LTQRLSRNAFRYQLTDSEKSPLTTLRVPENLAPFIPEILAGLVPSRNAKNLPMPSVVRPVGRRERVDWDAKASRNRESAQGRPFAIRGGPFEWRGVALGATDRQGTVGGRCRRCRRAGKTADWQAKPGPEFPRAGGGDSEARGQPAFTGDCPSCAGGGLSGRKDGAVRTGRFAASSGDPAAGSL